MIRTMQNKIGTLVKLAFNYYYDYKLIRNIKFFKETIAPLENWSTATQSVDYLYIIKSLKGFPINDDDTVLDLGSGRGRILKYLENSKLYKKNKIIGTEINKNEYILANEYCNFKVAKNYNVNVLENNFIIEQRVDVIILFNPFNGTYFKKFLEQISNIDYEIRYIYINGYNEHISEVTKSKLEFTVESLNYPLLGINDKFNIIGSNRRNENINNTWSKTSIYKSWFSKSRNIKT